MSTLRSSARHVLGTRDTCQLEHESQSLAPGAELALSWERIQDPDPYQLIAVDFQALRVQSRVQVLLQVRNVLVIFYTCLGGFPL